MVDKDLVDYIKKQLAAGHSEEEIREHLIGYGYQIREVDDAIELARGPKPLPAPPAAPMPPAPAKTTQVTKPAPKARKDVPKQTRSVGNLFSSIFKEWFVCIFKPSDVLKPKKNYLEFSNGFMHVLLAGVLAGLVSSIYVFAMLLVTKTSLGGASFISATTLISAFVTLIAIAKFPTIFLSAWLVLSALFYMFAIIIGGMGSFKDQSVLMSIVLAPMLFLGAVLTVLIPVNYVVIVYFILIGLSLYPLTISIKIAHNFETWKAALVWLIPLIIVLVLLIPAYSGIFSAIKSML